MPDQRWELLEPVVIAHINSRVHRPDCAWAPREAWDYERRRAGTVIVAARGLVKPCARCKPRVMLTGLQ